MQETPAPIPASASKRLQQDGGDGHSSIMMLGGYFYASALSEKHVPTPEGIAIMVGDDGIRGPFAKASEAQMNGEGRVANAVLDGAATKAHMNAVKLHGTNSEHALKYTPAALREDDIAASTAAVDAPRNNQATVAGVATDRGVDPLTSFRALAANGSIAKDDIRQLAAAYSHPTEGEHLSDPSLSMNTKDVRLDRKDAVTLAAIRKLEAGGMKNRAAEAYEDFGMSIAKKEGSAAAMPFLVSSCKLAREHTREHGRDIRPVRKNASDHAR